MLRSASDWSVGYQSVESDWVENSVPQAYLHEIMSAERFIYIENQFFISSTANPSLDKDGDGHVSAQVMKVQLMTNRFGFRSITLKLSQLKSKRPWELT